MSDAEGAQDEEVVEATASDGVPELVPERGSPQEMSRTRSS